MKKTFLFILLALALSPTLSAGNIPVFIAKSDTANITQAQPALYSDSLIFGHIRGASTLYGKMELTSGTAATVTITALLLYPAGQGAAFIDVGTVDVPGSGVVRYDFNLSALADWKKCTGVLILYSVPTEAARVINIQGYLLTD